MTAHKYQIDQILIAKSGKLYRVKWLRSDPHRLLNGEIGYSVVGRRNGEDFGPVRLMRESAFIGTTTPRTLVEGNPT